MGMKAVIKNDQGGRDLKRTIVLDLPTGNSISSKHTTIVKALEQGNVNRETLSSSHTYTTILMLHKQLRTTELQSCTYFCKNGESSIYFKKMF